MGLAVWGFALISPNFLNHMGMLLDACILAEHYRTTWPPLRRRAPRMEMALQL